MSRTKTLVSEDLEDGHSDPFYFPGEAEAELERAFRENELSHFTTEELEQELARRQEQPTTGALVHVRASISAWERSLDA